MSYEESILAYEFVDLHIRRRVPILFSGVSITVILPSAFVVFPTARLEGLPSIDYLRILAAGCFHNLVFWCLLYLVTWSKIGTVFSGLIFEDISGLGRVVVEVDSVRDVSLIFSLPELKSDRTPLCGIIYPLVPSLRGWTTHFSTILETS